MMEEDIKTDGKELEKVKKFVGQLDVRDSIILLLLAMMWLMYVIASHDLVSCNNYWINKTAEKTPELIANLTDKFIYIS